MKDLPIIINPKRGWIVTANNRQVPENFYGVFGATLTGTPRASRLAEMIRTNIALNKKMDHEDMLRMQRDTVDVVARGMTPKIIDIAES